MSNILRNEFKRENDCDCLCGDAARQDYCDWLELRYNTLFVKLAEATARAEKAERHCREHHLEPCETCMVTESDLIAVTAERDRLNKAAKKVIREMDDSTLIIDEPIETAINEMRAALTAPEKREVCQHDDFVKTYHAGREHKICRDCGLPVSDEKREVCFRRKRADGLFDLECKEGAKAGHCGKPEALCLYCGLPIVEEKE